MQFDVKNVVRVVQIYKELNEAYSENTDQLDRTSFSLYVHPALHLTNLLPIDVQCSIDVSETCSWLLIRFSAVAMRASRRSSSHLSGQRCL